MRPILRVLAAIGRYGTQGFAASLFVGLALPQLAAFARPFLGATVVVFLLATFVRIEPAPLLALLRRPGLLAVAGFCVLMLPAILIGGVLLLIGRDALDPGFVLGLAILAASPPIMSSSAVALMLRVEPAFVTATVFSLTAISPLLSPLLAEAVAGTVIPLDPVSLALRLAGLVGGGMAGAMLIRRVAGIERIHRHRASLDGIAVLMYVVFAIAAMDGVLPAIIREPALVAGMLAVVAGLTGAGFILIWLVLWFVPPAERMVLGYATGQRNMGLLVAALGTSAPPHTYLFFALAQFPIYIAPFVMRLLASRMAGVHPTEIVGPPSP